MTAVIARLIVALGLGLVALGRRIEGQPARPQRPTAAAKVIILQPGKHYRRIDRRAAPGKWEVWRTGLSIVFSSVAYATLGA